MARKNFIFKYGIDIAPNSNGIGTVFTVNNRTGNIGFGTTNPTSKIHVVGTIIADNFTGNSSYALQAGIATNVSGGTASVTQLNVSGITTLGIVTAGNIFSTGIITASSFSGNASSATQLQNSRNFSVTGDFITAPSVSFNGTGNVALAATITADSIVLGTYTSGDYVKNISGTTNQITVTGGTGEGSISTISLPNQFTAPQDVTVTRDLQVNRNLSINGTVTIGGTSATIFSQELKVGDPDIVLGFRTDGSGNDISTDNTANHGGVALASTEGSPLVQLFIAGIETNPATYKKIMWFKKDSFTGLGTDAWLINYAVGIGSTQFPTGTRLAAGSVQFTGNDLAVVRNINASGIVTATSFSGGGANLTSLTAGNLSGTIPSGVLGNSTLYVGTTAVTLNRSSASQSLTGINIDGSSASVANAVTFNNGGAGAASGTTFNGSAAQTISYNTLGASPLAGSSSLVTTGTVTSGTWSGSFGAVSGANLTTLNASNLGSGTVPVLRLGDSGTRDATTYLRGDNTWATITSGSTITVADDTSTNATRYPIFEDVTSGSSTSINVSSTKLTFNPSTGNLSATQFTSLSDVNKKKNIRPIENAIEIAKKLEGVRFDWKDTDAPSIGVIAQEVEKVLPELVVESDGVKSVSYGNIVGVLIEAIKEQQVRIEELERKLNA